MFTWCLPYSLGVSWSFMLMLMLHLALWKTLNLEFELFNSEMFDLPSASNAA